MIIPSFSCKFLLLKLVPPFQAEKVYNQDVYFKRAVKCVGEPMTHLESIASSAVCCFCAHVKFLVRLEETAS